jgi:hypothetical protein
VAEGDVLKRIDAHMERGNELMGRGNELFERNTELFVRNVELMDDVREELRLAREDRRLSREQHADLREFIRTENTRAERLTERQVRALDRMIEKIDDGRDETRARTKALLALIDRLQ